jgi:CheY-like chemotaxis protein
MTRLLLGVLDRGVLRLGDNSSVNFEKSIIFLTSNLGAREMLREISPEFGFQSAGATPTTDDLKKKLQGIATGAVRRKFSPEFVNRIDHVITYRPLDAEAFAAITDHEIQRLQRHVDERLTVRGFDIEVPFATRQWLIEKGTSAEYGARELKRTIHRYLTQPLATRVARHQINPGCRLRVEVKPDGEGLGLRMLAGGDAQAPAHPTLLLVDSNRDLLQFLERAMAEAGWDLIVAENAATARKLAAKRKPNAALVDLDLPDAHGIELGEQLRILAPRVQVTLMSGSKLTVEEEKSCLDQGFPVAKKPFLTSELMSEIRSRLLKAA